MRASKLSVQALLRIVDNLAVDLLLWTSFVDRSIRAPISGMHKLVSWHSHPAIIIMLYNVSVSLLEESERPKESESTSKVASVTVFKEVLIFIIIVSSFNGKPKRLQNKKGCSCIGTA